MDGLHPISAEIAAINLFVQFYHNAFNMTAHIIFVTENKSSLSSLLPLLSVEHSLDEIGRKLDQVWILNLLYLTF